MFEKYLGFKRMGHNQVEIDSVLKLQKDIRKPTIHEFNSAISPIWQKVIRNHGSLIYDLLENNDPIFTKDLFENFFVNGLSDGAAVGKTMQSLRTALKIKLREQRRLNTLSEILTSQNIKVNFDLDDFGKPWLMESPLGEINFELTDHFYFAQFIMSYIKNLNINDVIFLGDGCGYLAQAMLELDKNNVIKSVTLIDLYHFLCRQYLLLSRSKRKPNMKFYNAELNNYESDPNPKILVNQDSFPEISKEHQLKYFNMMKLNNVIALISYNKMDTSFGHEEFRYLADKLFTKKVHCSQSSLRKGYWLEVWHAL
jgi:hypothetical protein